MSAVRGSRFAVRLAHVATAAALAMALAACGGPNEPTPPGQPPAAQCPSNVSVAGVFGGAQAVSYALPTVTGGTQPVSVTCAPASGTTFSVGTTTVSCTATDASSRSAQCAFTVTLTPALRLAVTKFMAFGDSFTEGEDGRSLRLVPHFIDPAGTYPFLLEGMLNMQYAADPIKVLNYGKSGEPIDDGRQRLPRDLATQHPQALLLLDGYNDLLAACAEKNPVDVGSAKCAAVTTDVVTGYRKMIQIAKNAGVAYVFVSTLTPSGPYIPGPQVKTDRRIALSAITATNTKLVPVAQAEGATLVDSFAAFVGHEAEYIADDGLHPRRAGYQALADTFFAAIKSRVPSTQALH
jgi:lysophospholipase L1-like esterase